MMTSSSLEEVSISNNNGNSSSSSNNVEPKFILISIEPSQRESEQDKFLIESVRKSESDTDKKYQVTRSFLDFKYLEQQLFHTGQCLDGYILPPFPSKQQSSPTRHINVSSQIAESIPATQGKSKQLPGYGHFVSDEWRLFQWLSLVLGHPTFGRSGLLDSFLLEQNLPPPGRIVKASKFIKTIQDTIVSRKYAHKDCDTFFQNERDWCNKVHELMQTTTEALQSSINARNSLVQVVAHLSAALNVPIGEKTDLNQIALQDNLTLSRALECYNEFVEAEIIDEATSLGASLLLWTKLIESEREMLKQRTCLLVDYESANRCLDKARGLAKPEVEEAKINAERAFERCSEIARQEIKRFQDMRIKELGKVLIQYRNSQLALANESYKRLSLACKPFEN